MAFITDKQTLEDLSIFGKYGANSIFEIFNRCITRGGTALLEEMFRHPLSDYKMINQRSETIRDFAIANINFPFKSSLFDEIEIYIANLDERTRLGAQNSIGKRIGNVIGIDIQTQQIYNGVNALMELLKIVLSFIHSLQLNAGHAYAAERTLINNIVEQPDFASLAEIQGKLSHNQLVIYDGLLRFQHRQSVLALLRHMYQLDVYLSVAYTAQKKSFVFPKALPNDKPVLKIEGVYHPQVNNAVPNTIDINQQRNVLFLTGANMAGKSTLMKAVSIAIYVAHLGFPVPAAGMEFSVMDGIFTTINLPDDLGMGTSHFYAEVLRIKKIAQELNQNKNLFIVFDELFRGTNVKDAHEGTIQVVKGFAKRNSSLFLISTHIVEAGEILKVSCPNVLFKYLPTYMSNSQPVYTYELENGITADRHGMLIVKNEGILGILEAGIAKYKSVKNFIADQQTFEDLNLLGKFRANSIFGIFNKVKTPGGERLLEDMFRNPMTESEKINERSDIFQYFQHKKTRFPISKESFEQAEHYLSGSVSGNFLTASAQIFLKKIMESLVRDEQYRAIHSGLLATIEMLLILRNFLKTLDSAMVKEAVAILNDKRLAWLTTEQGNQQLSTINIARYDQLLRKTMRKEIEIVLKTIYQLDVYIAVSNVARDRGFSYAKALPSEKRSLSASRLWHPGLENAIANPFSIDRSNNVIFLTGANMAGKSTLMKSFGIAVYLAQMGFPVAAEKMQFSVYDGLFSSINVSDNLNKGYSHFYAEVLRVKEVAEEVSSGKNLVVVFDELFKGTNVKDAYDATLAVTTAFSKYRNCIFIISTHIIEVGEALKKDSSNIQFSYLPTVMEEGGVPRYTYQIREGITNDRQGMIIIENEGIMKLLGIDASNHSHSIDMRATKSVFNKL